MREEKVWHGCTRTSVWHIQKAFKVKPVITGTVTIEGEQFFQDDQGKLHIPEVFTRIWECKKLKVKPRFHKGANPDKTKIPYEEDGITGLAV